MTNLHFTHFSEHLLETKVRLFLTESTLFLECPVLGHQLSFLRGASRALAVSAAASEGVAPAAEDVALPARLRLGPGCGPSRYGVRNGQGTSAPWDTGPSIRASV